MIAAVSVNVVSSSFVGSMPEAFNLINAVDKSSTENCVCVENLVMKANASAPSCADPDRF